MRWNPSLPRGSRRNDHPRGRGRGEDRPEVGGDLPEGLKGDAGDVGPHQSAGGKDREVAEVVELGRITPEKAVGNVDVSTAKNLLEKAKKALLGGKYRIAKRLAEQSQELAKAARAYHTKVMNELRSLEDFIDYIASLKYDTHMAQEILDEAKKAILQLDYPGTLDLVEKARKILHRATFVPFPLLNKNLTIKTIVEMDKDKIIYKVRVENKSKKTLGEIVLLPTADAKMFAPVREQMMGELMGMQAKEVTFVLTPVVKNWDLGVPGYLIQGKDINLKTILECKNGTATYKVMIQNNKKNPIMDLKASPFVPKGLEPDEAFKIIEEIPPKGSEVLIFDLTPYHFDEDEPFQTRVSRYATDFEGEFPVEWAYSPDEEEGDIAEKVPVTGYVCPECEGYVSEEDDVCPHCGVRFAADDEEEEEEEEEGEEEEEEEEEEEIEIDEELLDIETTGFTTIKDKFKNMMFMPDIIQVMEPREPDEDEPDPSVISEDEEVDETEGVEEEIEEDEEETGVNGEPEEPGDTGELDIDDLESTIPDETNEVWPPAEEAADDE